MKKISLILAGVLMFAAAIASAAEQPAASADIDKLNARVSEINEDARMPQGESVIAEQLADDFKVGTDRINVVLGNMMQYGDVAAVLAFAEKMPGGVTNKNIDEVMKARFEGTWGQVAQNFGIDPGSIAGRLTRVQNGIQTALSEASGEGRAAGGGADERKAEPDRSAPLYQ